MEFFDKKEEVLDFQLTEYGRYLLSKGLFKPEFFAFLDDEILYDNEAAGFTQKQNEIKRRIQYDTPALKVQAYTVGAETRVNNFLNREVDYEFTDYSDFLRPGIQDNSIDYVDIFGAGLQFGEKFFMGQRPIGTSELKSGYAPAWKILTLTNKISASQSTIGINLTSSLVTPTDNGVVQPIPQLDITLDYQTFYSAPDDNYVGNKFIPLTSELNPEQIKLYVKDDYLIVEVVEENTDYLKENFEIEVFIPSDVHSQFGRMENLIFLDPGELTPSGDTTGVDYFMNILTDMEIPPQVAEEFGITKRVITGMENISRQTRVALNRDLYGDTDPEGECEG